MSPDPLNYIGQPSSEFDARIEHLTSSAAHAQALSVLTVNVGLVCNLECELCHHEASPERTETMQREVMLDVVRLASEVGPELIDVTGGEPTMWPLLGEFLGFARNTTERIRVRTNLDALLLPELANVAQTLAENRVEVLASLPEALEGRTVGGSVAALKRLACLGYGDPARGDSLPLDLAYNPLPGELPRPVEQHSREFAIALEPHGIRFRSLVTIVNAALGGYAAWLDESGEHERYRALLSAAFDPGTIETLPCRHGVTIAWDGTVWDCDYHLAACMALFEGSPYLREYVSSPVSQLALATRRIRFADHCFACTATAKLHPTEGE
jgi:radical SAM/Cys-rich protein